MVGWLVAFLVQISVNNFSRVCKTLARFCYAGYPIMTVETTVKDPPGEDGLHQSEE